MVKRKVVYHWYRNKRTGETYNSYHPGRTKEGYMQHSYSNVSYGKKYGLFGKKVAKKSGGYYIIRKPKKYS